MLLFLLVLENGVHHALWILGIGIFLGQLEIRSIRSISKCQFDRLFI